MNVSPLPTLYGCNGFCLFSFLLGHDVISLFFFVEWINYQSFRVSVIVLLLLSYFLRILLKVKQAVKTSSAMENGL